MARARNIKPGFYKNEDLAECSVWARFIYPGLWMLADREGRLEDRPKRIKGELLPYDSQEAEPLLKELAARGFILRYEVNGQKLIQVAAFKTHQSPHYTENASTFPAPILPESAGHDADETPGVHQEDTGSEAGLKGGALPPDSLIPDSLIQKLSSAAQPADPPGDNCPHSEIIAAYHAQLPALARVREWTPARQKLLRSRWREKPERQSVEWWTEFFAYVGRSDFLMGRVSARPGATVFEADLEWLVKPSNFVKVLEGKYDNRSAA